MIMFFVDACCYSCSSVCFSLCASSCSSSSPRLAALANVAQNRSKTTPDLIKPEPKIRNRQAAGWVRLEKMAEIEWFSWFSEMWIFGSNRPDYTSNSTQLKRTETEIYHRKQNNYLLVIMRKRGHRPCQPMLVQSQGGPIKWEQAHHHQSFLSFMHHQCTTNGNNWKVAVLDPEA